MKLFTSKRVRMHGCFKKETPSLWWWQYYRYVERRYYFCGLHFWSKRLASREEDIQRLIRLAFGN